MTVHEHDPAGAPDRNGRRDVAEADAVAPSTPRIRRVLAVAAAAFVGSLIGRWLGWPSWLTAAVAACLASFCLSRWDRTGQPSR